MYNVSLETLPRRLSGVLDCLDELMDRARNGDPGLTGMVTRLLDAHQTLLYALMEHVEDCYNITKSFFPKATFDEKKLPARISETVPTVCYPTLREDEGVRRKCLGYYRRQTDGQCSSRQATCA
jgi:hypothetical protein